jgi:hypothetical protein
MIISLSKPPAGDENFITLFQAVFLPFQPLASRAFVPPGPRGNWPRSPVNRQGAAFFFRAEAHHPQQPRPSTGSRSWRYKAEHGISARLYSLPAMLLQGGRLILSFPQGKWR